jgi:hypothetical protein
MVEFNHLKKLEVKDNTAKLTLYDIADEPALVLKPATDVNKLYFNAVLKRTRKRVRAVQAGKLTSKMMEQNRNEDRELFPLYVVVDWENVNDSDGNHVEYTPENCASFLNALPNWIFDQVREFASKSGNFIEEIEIKEKAGN